MLTSNDEWEEFFETHVWADVVYLAENYPDKVSLPIDFSQIQNYNNELAEDLEDRPDTTLENANTELRILNLPVANLVLDAAVVRIFNFPYFTKVRDIRIEHLNRLIAVDGIILKETEISSRIITSAHECKRCGEIMYIDQRAGGFAEPTECVSEVCGKRSGFALREAQSTFTDSKKIRLQEAHEDLRGGEHPQTIDMEFMGDLAATGNVGDRVTVIGIVRSVQQTTARGKTPFFKFYLDVNNVVVCEEDRDVVEITAEEREQIEKLAQDPAITDKLVNSFANTIKGHESEKEGILASIVSAESTLLPDGTVRRGNSHTLLCGDPGVAKTQLLMAAHSLVAGSQYCTGDGSTTVGLTAAVVKDDFNDGGWNIEAGALVLADRSAAFIDELDKIARENIGQLNTVLESGQVVIHKAGINRLLWARCPVIAAMNPKHGRFDPNEALPSQVNVPPATLSRFDLIFMMRDEPDPDKDRMITELQGRMWQASSFVDAGERKWSDYEAAIPEIPPHLMQKYLQLSKQIKVKISNECKDRLQKFFLSMRNKYGGVGAEVVPVTMRQLEALFRLAKAEARLRHSGVAELRDAERAIKLVSESLRQAGMDPETGELDSDIINTGVGKSQRDRIKMIKDVIKTLQGSNGSTAPLELIMQTLEAEGIKRDQVEDAIGRLKTMGEVIEMSSDRYRMV